MDPKCSSDCVCVPQEIYPLILSYLPVKSLLRFRSVSKEWKLTIENRDFTSLHLSHYANNRLESHVIALDGGKHLWYNRFPVSQFYEQKLEYDFLGPADLKPWYSSVSGGHVAGLFIVHQPGHNDDIVIWNPSIRKSVKVPPPPSYTLGRKWSRCDSFLGFDPSTIDYKVVSMFHSFDQLSTILEVFSLYSRSWRNKGDVEVCFDLDGSNRVSLGGFVHWLGGTFSNGGTYKKSLVSFNMTSETFSHTPLPNMLYLHDKNRVEGPIVSGCLIGFLTSSNGTTEIWVLDRDEQWSKKFRLDASIDRFCCWFYFDREGLLIWSGIDCCELVASDVNTGKMNVVSWDAWHSISYVGTYIESLVLLS